MSDSSEICFRPLKNLMSEGSICFMNSPGVEIVAMIVSSGCVSSC